MVNASSTPWEALARKKYSDTRQREPLPDVGRKVSVNKSGGENGGEE